MAGGSSIFMAGMTGGQSWHYNAVGERCFVWPAPNGGQLTPAAAAAAGGHPPTLTATMRPLSRAR